MAEIHFEKVKNETSEVDIVYRMVNVHDCQVLGHEINAHRCIFNSVGDQRP